MANEFEGDIVPFKRKGNSVPIKSYKVPNRANEQLELSNDLTPDDLVNQNEDMRAAKAACDITGEIVPYKKPTGVPSAPPEGGAPGGLPPGPPPTDLSTIAKILEEHHTMLQQIASIEEDLKNFLMGYSETGTYFELITSTTVATPDQPATPDTVANATTTPPTPGYDFIDVNKQKQGKNAQRLWIINDGPPAAGVGDNLYVITSSDGTTFSPEFTMIVGETRLVNNVYEVRIRSPKAGDVVRITEREAIVPYVTTVTNSLTPVSNRNAFTTNRIAAPLVGTVMTGGPSIVVPDSFALVVRSAINNPSSSLIYVANSLLNTSLSANRVTLAPGDGMKLFISNANLVFIRGSLPTGGEYIEWFVEQ